jgi:hypothetical protein
MAHLQRLFQSRIRNVAPIVANQRLGYLFPVRRALSDAIASEDRSVKLNELLEEHSRLLLQDKDDNDNDDASRARLREIRQTATEAHRVLEGLVPSLGLYAKFSNGAAQQPEEEKEENWTPQCNAVLEAWAQTVKAGTHKAIPQRAQFLLEQMVRPSVESFNRGEFDDNTKHETRNARLQLTHRSNQSQFSSAGRIVRSIFVEPIVSRSFKK